MCGIGGMMTKNGAAPSAAVLRALESALRHRGPDGTGHYANGDTAMVQTRLAIIDLATGDQPLREPGGAALIANGEIYNYRELRAAMTDVKFATQSDCEPPLYLYRRHGLDFPRHLRGMYAVAIHDPAGGRLVLARDPFGIKPLYYAEIADGLVFASEPHALIASGTIAAKLSTRARDELLALQFTTGHETIFAGVQRLLPGEIVAVEKGRIVERRRLDALPSDGPTDIGDVEAAASLDRVWADSIGMHQRSDVPYGMFLSGGIDSSAVLAMMARFNERPVTAFTAGFSGTAATDERALARTVASSFGAAHVEIDFGEADFLYLLPAVASAADDPAADYAMLPTFKLAATAHEAGLKVILSGEGGDELFAGYGRYRHAMRPWWLGGRPMRRGSALDGLGVLRAESARWREGIAAAAQGAPTPGRSRLQAVQAADCADWLPNDLLTKLDRCLMAHGVEGRTPFLDRAVAEFAFRLPDRLKVRKGLGKYLLREWLARHAPRAEPFSRKRGFTVPVGEWIARHGSRLGPLVAAHESIREICRPGSVESLFAASSGKREGFAAWSLLFYALWHRRHIEGVTLPPDLFAALD